MQVPMYSLKHSSTLHRAMDKLWKTSSHFEPKVLQIRSHSCLFAPIGESLLNISSFWVGLALNLSTTETWHVFYLCSNYPTLTIYVPKIVNICLHVPSTWRRTMLPLSLRNTSGTSWLFWPWGRQWNCTWATNRDQSRNTGHARFLSAVSPLAETSGIQGIILQEFVGKLKSQTCLILW